MDKKLKGHLAAFFCAIVWGTTFISTKVLLREFPPLDILFYRFLLGYVMLWLARPKWFKPAKLAHELYFLAAGASGVTIYYLLENVALTYSLTANVSIIISVAPFLTALIAHFVLKDEKMKKNFFIGFVVAILGVALVTFNGRAVLKLNPLGDMLAVGAAVVWASYSIIIRKMGKYEYPVIFTTRRIFFYGLLLMIPLLKPMGFAWNPAAVTQPVYLFNFLFLGICACALCFSVWSYAVDTLGAVISSNYIYAVPVITVVTSAIVLKEPITPMGVAGMVLTIVGLVISAR
ncbi:MAG: DMT family transporter [Hungatella hathewayi]|uniref:EamA domain-containing protein n=2 Tax=Hungatella hathewayi TaxID=154046 RepID=G5ICF6_9FIRM|nr:DMT family transporter [Hungatella hathewayi]EHI60806.1 hypothetical protein HMPREF9473_01183 [ [Hungatella hathewayi WAL-18680]MBS4987108.1 DMT family transporter [Hungatella hathewayi]MBS5065932.1 DMT family transporter [Hungatella hathewayi]